MHREHGPLCLRLPILIQHHIPLAFLSQIYLPEPLLHKLKMPRHTRHYDLRLEVRQLRPRAPSRPALVRPEAALGDELALVAQPAVRIEGVARRAEDRRVALDHVASRRDAQAVDAQRGPVWEREEGV